MGVRAACLLVSVLLFACARSSVTAMPNVELLSPTGASITLSVEIADDPSEHSRGLMFRESLAPGTGMLFVFSAPQPLSFWMKDTRIPLDIIFFDRDGTFVSSASMDPCAADPCPSTLSQGEAMYALEVPAGFASKHGIGPRWKLRMKN